MLEPGDDVNGQAWKVDKAWRVTEKLLVGRRTEDGLVLACSHLIVSPGDFVDVAVSIDINSTGYRGISVQLRMSHVVQLASAASFEQVSGICQFMIYISQLCSQFPSSTRPRLTQLGRSSVTFTERASCSNEYCPAAPANIRTYQLNGRVENLGYIIFIYIFNLFIIIRINHELLHARQTRYRTDIY